MQSAAQETYPGCEVILKDMAGFMAPLFYWGYKPWYLMLVDSDLGGYLLTYLFDISNHGLPTYSKKIYQALSLLDFFRYMYDNKFDLVVHTHFLSLEMCAEMRIHEVYHTPHVVVVTDFDAHAYWSVQPVEEWVVARDVAKAQLVHHNVPAERISVTGIPIGPNVGRRCPDPEVCLQELGLQGEKPIVLLLPFGPTVATALTNLLMAEEPMEIVVITGNNLCAQRELEAIAKRNAGKHVVTFPREKGQVPGFTRKMEKYMKCADVVVTKPGGLTTSEALASGCAVVVMKTNLGQEIRNSDMLLESGCAIKCTDPFMLGYKVQQLVTDRERLERMKRNSLALGTPNAAHEVVHKCQQAFRRGLLPHTTSASEVCQEDDSNATFSKERHASTAQTLLFGVM